MVNNLILVSLVKEEGWARLIYVWFGSPKFEGRDLNLALLCCRNTIWQSWPYIPKSLEDCFKCRLVFTPFIVDKVIVLWVNGAMEVLNDLKKS